MNSRSLSARILAAADVVTRMMHERLAKGPVYKISRMVKKGPLCPMAVLWLETRFEPGCPENDMTGTRYRHVAGFVSGEYCQPERVYASAGPGTLHVTRAEYERAMSEIVAAARAGRYDARLYPYKVPDVGSLPLPFAEEAHHAVRPVIRRRRARP